MKTVKKVSDLSGPALDWAVAKCEYPSFESLTWVDVGNHRRYSSNWAAAGPIIEREDIVILRDCDDYVVDPQGFTTDQRIKVWRAVRERGGQQPTRFAEHECDVLYYEANEGYTGPTPLIAVMRVYVASRLGDTIEIPEELL